MTDQHDLIVIGHGLSALASALWLSESGLKPLVVPVREQSGLLPAPDLSAALPWRLPPVMAALERRGQALMTELGTRLAQETGVDVPSRDVDLLLPPTLVDAEALASLPGAATPRRGVLADFEPQLAEGQRSTACLPGRRLIRCDRLARALRLALASRGVTVLAPALARRLAVSGNIVLGVELDDGVFLGADATVLAADLESDRLLYESGLEELAGGAPKVPALQFAPTSAALRCAVVDSAMMLLPQGNGKILAASAVGPGSTSQLTSDELRLAVHRRLPGLGRHDLECRGQLAIPGAGSRASIGPYPGVRGLWLNLGQAPFGPLLAPAAAEFLAEQLAGGPAVAGLEPTFSPSMQPSC